MKVPLLDTTPPPEFGAVHLDPNFADPHGANLDHTYVPGFSDLRKDRDVALAEVRAGARKAKDVPTLPVNLRWVRCQRSNGEPDNTKLWTAAQRGYVPVKDAQVGAEAWLKALPLGAVKDGNGMIRNGDTVLCVATAEAAGRNQARQQLRTKQRSAAAADTFAQELAKQHVAVKGTQPTVEASTYEAPRKKEK